MTKPCGICSEPFAARSDRDRYCSPVCRKAAARGWSRRWRQSHQESEAESRRRGNALRMARYRSDPEYRAARRQADKVRYHQLREAGVTVHKIATADEYERLASAQRQLCAICGHCETMVDPSGRFKRLAVDHDALTGDIRGLLCARCNMGIGLFDHDARRLQAAVEYMLKFPLADSLMGKRRAAALQRELEVVNERRRATQPLTA